MTRPIAYITGASSGIGAACAQRFAEAGYDLVLLARRKARLDETTTELQAKYGISVHSIQLDVRDSEAVKEAFIDLPSGFSHVDVLINNAGLAVGKEPIQAGQLDDWERMIDTNVKGLLYMSRIISRHMVERGKGHIINIGSTAGKDVYAGGGVYCATKHAVDALSRAMRIDLLPHGIKVSQIAPGAAETEFSEVRFKGDGDKAKSVYEGYQPLTGADVAELCYYVSQLPPHVCVNDLVVTATAQADSHHIHRG